MPISGAQAGPDGIVPSTVETSVNESQAQPCPDTVYVALDAEWVALEDSLPTNANGTPLKTIADWLNYSIDGMYAADAASTASRRKKLVETFLRQLGPKGDELLENFTEKDIRQLLKKTRKGEALTSVALLLKTFRRCRETLESKNQILSWQYAVGQSTDNIHAGIYYAKDEEMDEVKGKVKGGRISLAGFLGAAIDRAIKAEVLTEWPTKVVLCGHFSRADLYSLRDFQKRYKDKFDAVRRTYVTILKPLVLKCWDQSKNDHRVTLTLRDSMLLAPAGYQSLAAIGALIKEAKIELPPGTIERMDELLKSDYWLYKQYAEQDAIITLKYVLRMREMAMQLLQIDQVPATLSSFGLKHLEQLWESLGIRHNDVIGKEDKIAEIFNDDIGAVIPRNNSEILRSCLDREAFVTECYHGGWNEQYFFGLSTAGLWSDHDLVGAYTTVLCMIGMPRWDDMFDTTNIEDFKPGTLGYANVRFSFPQGTNRPNLPVQAGGSLIFPLDGISDCTAPEIYQARCMGAHIEILKGVVVPADMEVRPFEVFVKYWQGVRRQSVKGSLEDQFAKEIGNSLYGKLCQGLKKKSHFTSREGIYEDLPPSPITNPFLAAFVTGFIRATLGEIMFALPTHVEVSNATTDGILSTATEQEMAQATSGPICQLFADMRERLCGNRQVVEIKHQVKQVIGMRTRGQATYEGIENQKIVLAKAGVKPPMRDKGEQNEWIIETFLNRNFDTKITIKTVRQLPDMWLRGGDFTTVAIVRRVSLDYDWKRKRNHKCTRKIRNQEHLYFDTVPWQNIAEYERCRRAWKEFKFMTRCVLKTEEDLRKFEEYLSAPSVPGKKKYTDSRSVKIAWQMVLRALVRNEWGLSKGKSSNAQIAKWLTDGGYKTSKADLENAARPDSKLKLHMLTKQPKTVEFIEFIRVRFPDFQSERLYA